MGHRILEAEHLAIAELIVAMHEHAAFPELQLVGRVPQLGQPLVVVEYKGIAVVLQGIPVDANQVAEELQASELRGAVERIRKGF